MYALNLMLATNLVILCLIVRGECNQSQLQDCVDCPNYGQFLNCDPNTCDWLILNAYWAGNTTPGGEVLVTSCPLGYCIINDSSRYIQIPHSMTQTIGEYLCNSSHRMGIMCGQCQPGYAPAINSDSSVCVTCDSHSSKVNWIFYLLAVYVPLLVVFLAIIVFNIRLTTGPVNSFILFAQVISTTVDISEQGTAPLNVLYGRGTRAFESAYVIPYNFFNLNLFGNILPPFCLHESLDTLDIIALRYIEAVFPVMIIMAIVLLLWCQRHLKINCKLPSRHQKYRVGGSLVQAFAAFILLSYNRLLEITAYLLTPTEIFDHTLLTVERRVYLQGEYSITDPYYTARYKVPAYIMTAFLVVVPITLLHYPMRWLEKIVSKLRCLKLYPVTRVAIFLDAFQGCFKDNRRYFAGLYFALRLLLFFAFFQPWLLQLLIQQIIFVIYAFLLAYLKPYRDNHLNNLDTAMFTNLALINGLSWYTVSVNQTGRSSVAVATCIIFESILVFLPMVYLIAYLLWYSTKCCHGNIKTKTTGWYLQWKQYADKGTKGKDVSQIYLSTEVESFTDADYQVLTDRAVEQEESASNLRLVNV